jgi:hypothetical protein
VVSHDCTGLHSEELTPILDIPPVCYGGFRRDSIYRLQMACPSANLKRNTRDEIVASVEGRISQSNPCLNTEQNVLRDVLLAVATATTEPKRGNRAESA